MWNVSQIWRRIPAALLDAGLDLGGECAGRMGSRHNRGDASVRWLELRNKITAYRLFEGRSRSSPLGRFEISRLDPYCRLFAAEGYGYRNALSGVLRRELLDELSPIAIHAGAGLRFAEDALASINAGRLQSDVLAEFSAMCRRDACEGFSGIMEEALGLLARTLYPHLMERLDESLGNMDAGSLAHFWHGAGRGIYFALGNIVPFRAVPWMGVGMCLAEPKHETGKRNALSGFCFALTLVNLRQPEVLEAFFKHHAAEAANGVDGIQAALAVWTLSGAASESNETLAPRRRLARMERIHSPVLWPCSVAGEDRRRPERLFSARVTEGGLAQSH